MSYDFRSKKLKVSHVLPQIAFDLLKKVQNESLESNKISDDNLLTLHSVFGNILKRALDINSKRNSISIYTLENGFRSIIEVRGSNDQTYRLLPDVNFCFCSAFQNYVIQLKTEITCKHILAAYIAIVTQSAIENIINREQFDLLFDSFVASDDFELL